MVLEGINMCCCALGNDICLDFPARLINQTKFSIFMGLGELLSGVSRHVKYHVKRLKGVPDSFEFVGKDADAVYVTEERTRLDAYNAVAYFQPLRLLR